MENVMKVSNLTKRYQGFMLDHISFQIPKGSIVGFIGENGAGKSTTIRAILGLTPIEEGEVELLGHKIGQERGEETWREQVGVVFDECNLPAQLKVKYVQKIMKNMFKTWDEGKFAGYLKRFELPENKKINELSKGMKMKLSIAIALSHDSRLLILDEATSGLDPVIRSEILDIFREFIENEEHTVFISSHIISDIEKIADYVMLIHKGQILFMENKDELLFKYGIVKCTKEQAAVIPKDIIVGKEENEFGVSVLVKDREQVMKPSFTRQAESLGNNAPLIDRAGIEDMLLYVVRAKDNHKSARRPGQEY